MTTVRDNSTMALKNGLLRSLLSGEILGDPRQHELQYANRVPFAILSALTISSQDVGMGFSHCTKSIKTQTNFLSYQSLSIDNNAQHQCAFSPAILSPVVQERWAGLNFTPYSFYLSNQKHKTPMVNSKAGTGAGVGFHPRSFYLNNQKS